MSGHGGPMSRSLVPVGLVPVGLVPPAPCQLLHVCVCVYIVLLCYLFCHTILYMWRNDRFRILVQALHMCCVGQSAPLHRVCIGSP